MSDRKKWYQIFVDIEEEEQKGEKQEDIARIDAYSEIPTQSGQFDEPPSFEQIYQTVGIKLPSHGFNIYRIEDMLKSQFLKDMNSEQRKNSILVALEAIKIPIEDIIQDAINRDKALDSYEKYEEKKLKEFENRKSEENKKIQEEIERFFNEKREQIQSNDKLVNQARDRFKAWQEQKKSEEKRLFEAMRYFTPEHPIGTIFAAKNIEEGSNEESKN